mmetsp:Transcript_26873/g.72584  ORF Transcript_26873/g.72584 Transcript_26873/m.72584 type:complete len:218 (+) Transcript_26873:4171-4824(+)
MYVTALAWRDRKASSASSTGDRPRLLGVTVVSRGNQGIRPSRCTRVRKTVSTAPGWTLLISEVAWERRGARSSWNADARFCKGRGRRSSTALSTAMNVTSASCMASLPICTSAHSETSSPGAATAASARLAQRASSLSVPFPMLSVTLIDRSCTTSNLVCIECRMGERQSNKREISGTFFRFRQHSGQLSLACGLASKTITVQPPMHSAPAGMLIWE